MKKYTKTTIKQEPRLQISYCDYAESPREWSNLGYFITKDSNLKSPDSHEQLENIIRASGDEAQNYKDHVQIMVNLINTETNEKVLAIYPVVKYEHGGICYSLGQKHGFDYSNNGFYIITDKTQKETGTKKKDFKKVIRQEIEIYNKWINGEVYEFILFDKNGELIDSCDGFYAIEDIREYLPAEWKNEDLSEYFVE